MSFLEFPWLVGRLFVEGHFDPSAGPSERPIVRRRFIAAVAVSVIVALAILLLVEVLLREKAI